MKTISGQFPSIPLHKLFAKELGKSGVSIYLKREDLILPSISGNKWWKLKYNLIEAACLGHETLLTFGGAFSNHIAATAAAGKEFGFETVGVIRGEEHNPLNPVLGKARDNGMQFHYLDRATYRRKMDNNVQESLKAKFGEFYLLPEGGSNALAVKGCAEMVADISIPFDIIVCPVGTGGTLAGIISGISPQQHAIGISVLKGGEFLNDDVKRLLPDEFRNRTNWRIELDYHFGGYAKFDLELEAFIEQFQQEEQIPLDPIYTGKMMFAIYALVRKRNFANGSIVVAIHTGSNPFSLSKTGVLV